MLGIYWPPFQALLTGALWFFGSSTVIPGVVDAPLIPPSEAVLVDEDAATEDLKKIMNAAGSQMADGEGERVEIKSRTGVGKMPCLVFTHGMAGMSQSYSHYLGSIASHGVVVAAVEHRDGSGPGTIVHYANGTHKEVWHMQLQDLEYVHIAFALSDTKPCNGCLTFFRADPPMTLSNLKKAQLNFREAEIQETIRLFKRLNAGGGNEIINLKPHSPEESLPSFEDRLDLDAVTVAGHSYGATGVLQALKSAHSEDTPINGGIALDPGKASGPLNKDIDVPLLVMQSGEWTEKQVDFYGQGSHFEVVRRIVQSLKDGWFMTLTGTAHPSCTDAPLIVPWIMKMVLGTTLAPKVALDEYIDVSVEFLDFLRTGKKKGILKSNATSPDGPIVKADERNKVRGKEGGDWEVHVAPK
jgi:platelet-activating factor acetylhydrolase